MIHRLSSPRVATTSQTRGSERLEPRAQACSRCLSINNPAWTAQTLSAHRQRSQRWTTRSRNEHPWPSCQQMGRGQGTFPGVCSVANMEPSPSWPFQHQMLGKLKWSLHWWSHHTQEDKAEWQIFPPTKPVGWTAQILKLQDLDHCGLCEKEWLEKIHQHRDFIDDGLFMKLSNYRNTSLNYCTLKKWTKLPGTQSVAEHLPSMHKAWSADSAKQIQNTTRVEMVKIYGTHILMNITATGRVISYNMYGCCVIFTY